MIRNTLPSPIEEIQHNIFKEKNIRFFIKREDLLDPVVSGNKFRKLKYNIAEAKLQSNNTLLTFGGAYSNHIHALAYAGKKSGFKTIGIIRGEKIEPFNATLSDAASFGMQLEFISREAYRDKTSEYFMQKLKQKFGNFYVVPEGGSNTLAVKGCEELVYELEEEYDYVCCSSGTGGTLAGIICGLDGKSQVLGFPALKGAKFLKEDISRLIKGQNGKTYDNWRLMTDFHFGGYARFTPELVDFINDFKVKHSIQLDPVYTGKMFYGIFDLAAKDYFKAGSKILAIHTGGLQGIRGFNERFGSLIR